MSEEINVQLRRVQMAGITLADEQAYLEGPDSLGNCPDAKTPNVPGYKRCGGCKQMLKLYLFNVNKQHKLQATGNCKKCQAASAAVSYTKNKGKRDHKKYYEEHKEQKLAHSRRIYQANKDTLKVKQKAYHQSAEGRKVMQKAHAKRRKLIASNAGIKYKREWVIDRDKRGGEHPICYLCNEAITVPTLMDLDHVIPIALKGSDCFTNVAMTHRLCNLRKEKDARRLSATLVEGVVKLAEEYISTHPELFEDTVSQK